MEGIRVVWVNGLKRWDDELVGEVLEVVGTGQAGHWRSQGAEHRVWFSCIDCG